MFKLLQRLVRAPRSLIHRYRVKVGNTPARKASLLKEQTEAFAATGLSRQDGLTAIEGACREGLGHGYDETNGMFSEHLILLAAIACAHGERIRNVLEVGTFDGRTAVLLSWLFPGAQIKTIDLPSDSPLFTSSYQRSASAEAFEKKRNSLLATIPNVSFEGVNSLCMSNWTSESFDLIWVDGAHGYPVVCCDLINTYRLARIGGIVMVDDVWTERSRNDAMYDSTGAHETLESMRIAGLLDDYSLFLKRTGPAFNIKHQQKYIGYFTKRL